MWTDHGKLNLIFVDSHLLNVVQAGLHHQFVFYANGNQLFKYFVISHFKKRTEKEFLVETSWLQP